MRSSGLPWTIARPSIVVGESDTGWTSSFNVLYAPLRAFAAGAYPLVPARRRAPLDVVSVDYVADAVIALARHPQASGGTFHLTAGACASTVGEILELATGELERRAPRLVPPRAYRRLHPFVLRRAPSTTRRLLSSSEVYFPYFAMRQRFDDARSRALLEPMGIEPTPLGDYFHRLMSFARAARWARWAGARPRRCSGARQRLSDEAHGHRGHLWIVLDRAMMTARDRHEAAAGRRIVQRA